LFQQDYFSRFQNVFDFLDKFITKVGSSYSPDSSEKPMPVANYFLWCLAERPKEAPESTYKKSWQPNSLQRMAGIAPEKKNSTTYAVEFDIL
jgi:hypothetical protein